VNIYRIPAMLQSSVKGTDERVEVCG